MKEEWRIVDRNDAYAVSSLSEVKRIKPGRGAVVGKVRKQFPDDCGYLEVRLPKVGTVGVHKLVAEAFLGPCPPGKEVNHKDGNKKNNRPSNLEYKTHKQNVEHAADMGLMASGERSGRAKLTKVQVKEIRRSFVAGEYTKTQLAKMHGVSFPSIHYLLSGKNWGWLQ